jgi:hypothetical protein
MKVNLSVVYAQGDTRWGSTMLGFNTELPYNIANFGCLLTCLTMACKYYGKDENPDTLNTFLKEKKGFADGGNYVWGAITKCYPDIKEVRTMTPSLLTDAQIQEIKTAIDDGYPVMVHLDYNPKTVKNDMHFVLLIDYNPNDENDFTIADPLGGKICSLKTYLGWFKPNARNTIEQYDILKGKVPVESAGKTLVSTKEWGILNIIKEQWSKIIAYLSLNTDPSVTLFEDVQRVIGGIKSRQTDLENQLKSKEIELQKANKEVQNRIDQLANQERSCQESAKLKLAEYNALKATLPDIEKLKGSYEGTLKEREGRIRELEKAGGIKDLRITELETQLVQGFGDPSLLKLTEMWLAKLLKTLKRR